jgi:hypothetical protein
VIKKAPTINGQTSDQGRGAGAGGQEQEKNELDFRPIPANKPIHVVSNKKVTTFSKHKQEKW